MVLFMTNIENKNIEIRSIFASLLHVEMRRGQLQQGTSQSTVSSDGAPQEQ
jgi:hypothetical protein